MLGNKTGDDMKIFSGNANPDLAREIAAYLGTQVGDAVINRFNNGEVQVMINESVRGKDVFVIQPTCGPSVNDNVMELLIMCDAFKRQRKTYYGRCAFLWLCPSGPQSPRPRTDYGKTDG